MNVLLNPHFETFVAEAVASGRFNSSSEVVREALRLLEEREIRLNALRHKIEEARASGEPVAFDPEDIKRRGRATLLGSREQA
ncbi:MAG: type II toxin-antitoxin system ParD family antitoxin [Rhodospirillales bacterium]|nr:type II toxin-antitoxin system ParD family antitoxin [Rhodospirillales bacterium]